MPGRAGRSVALALLLAGCAPARPASPPPVDPAGQVTRLADEYVSRYFQRSPEAATRRGLPADNGGVVDNSLAAVADWRLREDGWLGSCGRWTRPRSPADRAWPIYGILRELLEDSVATRVCRNELWSLNTNIAGWQSQYTSLSALQPVGTDSLAGAGDRPGAGPAPVSRTEQTNLREGIRQGYVAPRTTVEAIVRQLDGLLATPPDSSPFASPAARDSSPAFRQAYLRAVAEELLPAIGAYRRFLVSDYLPHARTSIGVSANPDGMACYEASVRRFSTLSIIPGEVFRAGEQQLALVEEEMRALGERTFGTGDVPALLRRLREDTAWTFRTRREILDRSNEAIARAKAAAPRWFGRVPRRTWSSASIPSSASARGPCRRTARRRMTGAGPESSASPPGSRSGSRARASRTPRFTRRFPVITSRTPSPRSDARHIRSPGTSTSRASAKAGRCMPSGWPTRWVSTRGTWTGWVCSPPRAGARLGWSSTPASTPGAGPGSRRWIPHRPQHAFAVGRRGGGGSLHLVAGASHGVHAGKPRDPRHSPGRRGAPQVEVRYPGVPRRAARRRNHHAADAAGADGAVAGGTPVGVRRGDLISRAPTRHSSGTQRV